MKLGSWPRKWVPISGMSPRASGWKRGWNTLPASRPRLGRTCFGKDTAALVSTATEYNLSMPIVAAAREINRRQRDRVVEKLLGELKILKGRTIGLLGLAFKPNTDDLREAPAIDIARKLIERGCKVRVHDPVAMERFEQEHGNMGTILCSTPEDVAEEADALVLVTEWQEYRELDWEALAGRMKSQASFWTDATLSIAPGWSDKASATSRSPDKRWPRALASITADRMKLAYHPVRSHLVKPRHCDCIQRQQKVGKLQMLLGAIISGLLIFGLFLSMLSSSPKAKSEEHFDSQV